MRFRNLFILGIGFVLLAFVYWPSNTPNSKMERQTFTQQPDSIPLTDPSIFTAQLNNYLSDYMDRSVQQGIPAVANTEGLRKAFRAKKLVLVSPNTGYTLDTFQYSYAMLTPYAAQILTEIGLAFHDSIAKSPLKDCQLIVTSMTRTKYTVAQLMPTNRTAVRRSPHLNGNAFDFSYTRFKTKKELTEREQNYLRTIISEILVRFKKDIKIWATFEAREECLHVVARKGV